MAKIKKDRRRETRRQAHTSSTVPDGITTWRAWRDRIARVVVVMLARKLMVAWQPLLPGAATAWKLAQDETRFASLLLMAGATFAPKDYDGVCLLCLERRIDELPGKWARGLHGRYATTGPVRPEIEYLTPVRGS